MGKWRYRADPGVILDNKRLVGYVYPPSEAGAIIDAHNEAMAAVQAERDNYSNLYEKTHRELVQANQRAEAMLAAMEPGEEPVVGGYFLGHIAGAAIINAWLCKKELYAHLKRIWNGEVP